MTSRARLFTLAARKQGQQIAELAREFGAAKADHAAAMALGNRLHALMTGLAPTAGSTHAAGSIQASSLRDTGDLIMKLAQEADQQQDRAQTLQARLHMLQSQIAIQDQRRRSIQKAADAARRMDRDAAEARIEAARPPALPRKI